MLKKYARTLGYAWANYRKGRAVYPFYASLKVSNICASTCSFCDIWKQMRENPRALPKEDCFKIIDNIANSSVLVLSIEGGEPFLHKDIIEILRYAASKTLLTEVTCSARPDHFKRYPLREAEPFINFLHLSIDEGHNNLELFDRLSDLRQYHKKIAIQIVVSNQTVNELEWKIKKLRAAGMWTIIMPAAPLDNAEQILPDLREFVTEVARLKKLYPYTILTSDYMLENLLKTPGGCSASSVVIDDGGKLYYPCRVLEKKTIDLTRDPLNTFVVSDTAEKERDVMDACDRPCGWCQYYATASGTTLLGTYKGLKPWIQYALRHQRVRFLRPPDSEETVVDAPQPVSSA